MTADQVTALINLGAAGAVIIVVVYFLRFIKERDKDWQQFFSALLNNKDAPITEIADGLQTLLAEFRAHDQMERAKLEEMSKTIHGDRKTQQRKT